MRPLFYLALVVCASVAVPVSQAQSPWNGSWKLDPARSTPGAKDMAAEGYRFAIEADGRIKWEIPSLGEVVTGYINGQPMAIHRTEPTPGLTLSVEPESPFVLHYRVARDGKPEGEGRMTLVENGKAWVDISWPAGKPQYAGKSSM